jgi:molybdopterin-binding protein
MRDCSECTIFSDVRYLPGESRLCYNFFNIQWRDIMRLSARNVLKGKIKQIKVGAVNSEVVLELSQGVEIVSIITRESAEKLQLSIGKEAYAVVKASNVMIAVD